jgi:hypothetical protein
MPRRLSAVLVLLLVAACGSTNRASTDVTATSAPGGIAPADPSATAPAGGAAADDAPSGGRTAAGAGSTSPETLTRRGAPTVPAKAITSPIEIGFVRTGVSNAGEFGVDFGETVSEAKVIDALVKAYNAAGGIAGRKIVPIYADTDTATNRWDADFAAACATFTQDHDVKAVLGYVFDFQPPLEDCLRAKGIPHLSTSFNVPDTETMRRYPLLEALSTPRIERRSFAKIDGAIRDRILTKAKRLGVLMDTCPGTERAWDAKVRPYLKRRGITPASVEKLSCAGGSSDNGRAIREVQNAILRMRAARIDTVMPHSVSEGPGVLVFSVEASAQNWHPTYIVSTLVNAAVLGSQMPAEQAAKMHGYGWMPAQDVPPSKWPATSSSGKRCIEMVRKQGLSPSSATDYSFVLNTCEALFLYERALRVTNGSHDGRLVIGAIEAMGKTFVSALNLEGGSFYSRTAHDAPSRVRHFAWDGGCSCFTYRGASHPMPEVP